MRKCLYIMCICMYMCIFSVCVLCLHAYALRCEIDVPPLPAIPEMRNQPHQNRGVSRVITKKI